MYPRKENTAVVLLARASGRKEHVALSNSSSSVSQEWTKHLPVKMCIVVIKEESTLREVQL
jgi:hypothetical protein